MPRKARPDSSELRTRRPDSQDVENPTFDCLIEDVYVLKTHPHDRSVRAVKMSGGEIILYSTDADALREIGEALGNGATVRGKRIVPPSRDELEAWLDPTLLPYYDRRKLRGR